MNANQPHLHIHLVIVRCLHVSNIIIQIVSLSWSVGSRFLERCVSHSISTLTVGKNLLCLHNVSHLEERIGSAAVAAMAQLWRESSVEKRLSVNVCENCARECYEQI